MKLSHPVECIIDDVRADFVAVRPVIVNGASPRSSVPIREVGAEVCQIIPFRSEVVIDYIQYDGDASVMAGIDERFKTVRSAIRGLDRKERYAVISPVARARKLGDRHEFDCRDAHIVLQVIEQWDNALKCSLPGKPTDMEFINDEALKRNSRPALIGPPERIRN